VETIVEPLQLRDNFRERSNLPDTKEEYDRILERLYSKIRKPLHDLRVMIESEIERLKNGE
jgi:hypothetical protein